MSSTLRVLHLEDDPDFAGLAKAMLEKEGFEIRLTLVDSCTGFTHALEREPYDIILADYALPTCTGIQALEIARERCPDTPFILISGTVGEQTAIESLKQGATDYVLKLWIDRLVPTVRRAVSEAQERWRRKRAEAELARRDRYLRALTENSPDVLTILSAQGVFSYNSPSVKHVLGFDACDLEGNDAFELVHPEDVARAREAFQAVLQKPDQRIRQELRYRRRDGSWCHLEVVAQNRLEDPDIAGVVLNTRDVTERKEVEAQLRQAQKMEALGQLAGGVAHDLNNILTPVMMSVELLHAKASRTEDQDLLTRMQDNLKHGADILRQILWLGRGLKGKRELVDVGGVLEEIARFVRSVFDKSIKLHTQVSTDLQDIMGDGTHVYQVLLNLCLNARDAMPSGGLLTLGARNVIVDEEKAALHAGAKTGQFVQFEVGDTGTGIPAEVRERLFEPFFTTKEKGTGLGLSTVQMIVKSYQGFIEVESEAGSGTTFRVFLPAHEGCGAKHP